MIQYIFLVGFFLMVGILLYAEAKHNMKIRYVCMLSLMPLLLLYYIFSLSIVQINWLIVIALIFGYLGDIFLMFNKEEFFVFGLGSFLLGHIFYIIAFLLSISNIMMFPIWTILLVLPSLFVVFYVIKRTLGKLGEVKVPTYIYIGVIFFMGFCAILRFASFDLTSAIIVWLGANLFMLSDGMIALNKFDKDIPKGEIYIKLTYVLAQFFIILGVLIGS
ncbi:MAG: lysoplasmalogenase [Promethearchaeota archaeon]|nr:MAG: lysoplasmalogenase [Candidatus Lokiarchaeota archaeon]